MTKINNGMYKVLHIPTGEVAIISVIDISLKDILLTCCNQNMCPTSIETLNASQPISCRNCPWNDTSEYDYVREEYVIEKL